MSRSYAPNANTASIDPELKGNSTSRFGCQRFEFSKKRRLDNLETSMYN